MSASATDLFIKVTPNFATTIGGGGVASGIVTTIPLTSVSNLPTDTAIELVINRVDTSGEPTDNFETVRGVISGSNLTSTVRGVEGTAQAWDAGVVVEYLATGDIQNRLVTGILTEHTQDGTHGNITQADGGYIKDTSSNELLKFSKTASAVNEVTVKNAATGNPPEIQATGGDTNIDIAVQPKGTGAYVIKGTSTSSAEMRLSEDTDNGSNYIGLKAPASIASNLTFTLPSADGTAGQALVTNASGVLSFATAGSNDGWVADTNTWTYSSADGATGIFTVNADLTGIIQAGDRIKLTQTTPKYFIVTKTPTYGAPNTTITVWGGTDYTLANAAISSPYYSHVKDPFGFNTDPSKWTITTSSTSDSSGSSAGYNNVGSMSIDIHIGTWAVSYQGVAFATKAGQCGVITALSTANNTQGDVDMTAVVGGSTTSTYAYVHRSKILTLASKTTYYLNTAPAFGSETGYGWKGATYGTIYIRAVCAYL